jgi:alkylation response protein AidB-like acyl-CoA dehydrogenase
MTAIDAGERALLVGAVADLLRAECTPEVVAEAERGDGWSPALWKALKMSGMTNVGVDASFPDALAVVRTAARFAAPVPLAETVIAHFVDPGAGEGPLAVAAGGRASYGRIARRIIGVSDYHLEPDVNLAGEPWDRITPGGLTHLLPAGALVRAAQMAGALETVLDLVISYVREREQFGQPLVRFQAVQQQLALLAGEAMAATAAVERAALAPSFETIAASKIRCGEAVTIGTAIAHQLHGAIGMTHEHRLQQFTRRLWSWRDDFGSESEWAIALGKAIAESGSATYWAASAPEQRVDAVDAAMVLRGNQEDSK